MTRHDEPPREAGELPPEVLAAIERIRSSEYTKYVEELRPLVKGKTVIDSTGGKSGFVLFLDDGSWVEAFLLDGFLRWVAGTGQPGNQQCQLLNSPACGDRKPTLKADLPYAKETCDIQSEVAKAHGAKITGVGAGEDSFNFHFPKGLELDAMIVPGADGKPSLRVFWEQW